MTRQEQKKLDKKLNRKLSLYFGTDEERSKWSNVELLPMIKQRLKDSKASKNSKKGHSLTLEYLVDLFIEQRGKCAISKSYFCLMKGNDRMFSLDRKDSSKGYVPGNVWWVWTRINIMKGPMPMNELADMSRILHLNL